jgi:hypothetical protein
MNGGAGRALRHLRQCVVPHLLNQLPVRQQAVCIIWRLQLRHGTHGMSSSNSQGKAASKPMQSSTAASRHTLNEQLAEAMQVLFQIGGGMWS